MPFVSVALTGPAPTATVTAAIQHRMTEAMVTIMGKKEAVTAVRVETHAAPSWSIGGRPVTGRAAHVEIAVTRGTNDTDQIAALIAATAKMLREDADVDEAASYVIVRDLPADHWGYDGLTQAARAAVSSCPRPGS